MKYGNVAVTYTTWSKTVNFVYHRIGKIILVNTKSMSECSLTAENNIVGKCIWTVNVKISPVENILTKCTYRSCSLYSMQCYNYARKLYKLNVITTGSAVSKLCAMIQLCEKTMHLSCRLDALKQTDENHSPSQNYSANNFPLHSTKLLYPSTYVQNITPIKYSWKSAILWYVCNICVP